MESSQKHSLHGQIAASVWLKLFIVGNERCHTIDAPSAWVEEIHCLSNKVNHNLNDWNYNLVPSDLA